MIVAIMKMGATNGGSGMVVVEIAKARCGGGVMVEATIVRCGGGDGGNGGGGDCGRMVARAMTVVVVW